MAVKQFTGYAKWWILSKCGRKNPLVITMGIGYACNLRCRHCHIDSMLKANPGIKAAQTYDEIVTDPQTAEEARLLVESFAKMLPAFKVETALRFGKAGPEIVSFAKDGAFDSILMTRSSRGSTQKLGSVSTYVVHNASFITTTVLREPAN